MKTALVIIVFSVFLFSCETPEDEYTIHQEIEQIVRPYLLSGTIAGLAAGTYDNGTENMYFFGNSNLENNLEIDETTMFEIGSVTKTFTSVILAEMELEGRISRQDKLQDFMPDWVNIPEFNGTPIKLIHLSNQTSSLPYMPDNFDLKQLPPPFDSYTIENLNDYLNSLVISREPGSAYEYSNTGPGILGLMLSQIDSTTCYEMIRKHILDPLGMHSTVAEFDYSVNENVATGYLGKREMQPWLFAEVFFSSGALKSNLSDMMKYLVAHMDEKQDLLHSAMTETHKPTFHGEYTMGMAWYISELDSGEEVIWHNGGTGGFASLVAFMPKLNKGIVLLINSQTGQELEIELGQEILQKMLSL